ncbi:MAG: SRPBCC domain-containing protein [Caulobacteraceae bacterium]|nr:SRPBCC domain-containing protein [Caulobacteraceae bacterium]
MSEPDFEPAWFTRKGDVIEARLCIMLDEHVEQVWAALTEPEHMVQWLAPGEIELRQGGAARLNFADSGIVIDSTVTAINPLHLLEYSWSGPGEPNRPVRWELEPVGGVVRLDLTLTVPANEDAARAAAGWAAHLEMLAAALAGVPIRFPFDLFKAARAAYQAQLAEEKVA